MKFLYIPTLLLLGSFPQFALAQSASTKPLTNPAKTHLQVYHNALSSGDYPSAILALNYVVALESKTSKYCDSLAYLYYSANQFYQALYWSNEILKIDPNNIGLLEVKAGSLKQTNQLLPAIEAYEYLLKLAPKPAYAFDLVEIQYQVKRLYECLNTTKLVESMEIPKGMVYSYKVSEQQSAQTPLMAAFLNYRGLALYDLGQKAQAVETFQKAVNLDSGFLLAQSNLQTVKKELATTPASPIAPAPIDKQPSNGVLPKNE